MFTPRDHKGHHNYTVGYFVPVHHVHSNERGNSLYVTGLQQNRSQDILHKIIQFQNIPENVTNYNTNIKHNINKLI